MTDSEFTQTKMLVADSFTDIWLEKKEVDIPNEVCILKFYFEVYGSENQIFRKKKIDPNTLFHQRLNGKLAQYSNKFNSQE